MASQEVAYQLDDETEVRFEIAPSDEWRPVGKGHIVGKVRDAAAPLMEAAGIVLDQAKAHDPDEVQVKFGVKVTGTAKWLIAAVGTDANFEVTLTWRSSDSGSSADPESAEEA